MSAKLQPIPNPRNTAPEKKLEAVEPVDTTLGHYLRQARKLSDAQIQQILDFQHQHGLRFGEAAVALKLATTSDILWALSQQFHYPYAADHLKAFDDELVVATDPFCEQSEIFRDLRSQLLMSEYASAEPRRALAVLSPNSGDGKSYVAANLAISLSQLGGRVLLIDADMRTPRQHKMFKLRGMSGLSGLLAGRTDGDVIRQIEDLSTLYVMPVGIVPPNPLELIQRPAFGLLLQELLTKFDHVIVDSPAASHGSDARVLAARCGAALIIGRRANSRMKDIQSLMTQLAKGPSKLVGVMINEH